MTDSTFFLLFAAAVVVGLLAYAFIRKRAKREARTSSVTGKRAYPNGTLDPLAWFIPVIPGRGSAGIVSQGMPLHPQPHPEGFALDLPQRGSELDQLLFNPGPLTGKRQLLIEGRIEADAGVEFISVSKAEPDKWRSAMTPFLKRAGDDWSMEGKFADYRWFQHSIRIMVVPGPFSLGIPLTPEGWEPLGKGGPAEFAATLAEADAIGLVFGGNEESSGHGMFATGPARLVITKAELR
jgi:hypothetical protein